MRISKNLERDSMVLFINSGGVSMKVGDLVYVPYFKEYGIIVGYALGTWRIIYTSGYHSEEHEEDLEVACK